MLPDLFYSELWNVSGYQNDSRQPYLEIEMKISPLYRLLFFLVFAIALSVGLYFSLSVEPGSWAAYEDKTWDQIEGSFESQTPSEEEE